jgi:hypothetical protein
MELPEGVELQNEKSSLSCMEINPYEGFKASHDYEPFRFQIKKFKSHLKGQIERLLTFFDAFILV